MMYKIYIDKDLNQSKLRYLNYLYNKKQNCELKFILKGNERKILNMTMKCVRKNSIAIEIIEYFLEKKFKLTLKECIYLTKISNDSLLNTILLEMKMNSYLKNILKKKKLEHAFLT